MTFTREFVKPYETTWSGRMPVSELDHTGFMCHTPSLNIYKYNPNQGTKTHIIDTLKNALSRVLVPFYPLAGRLHWVGDGGRLELDCNAEGVEFIEDESTRQVSDFGDFSSSYKNMFDGLLPDVDYINTPLHEIPLMYVQVTWFKCGGMCIGMSIAHVIADAIACFHFFREFAKLSRGDSSIKELPFLDRGVLRATTTTTTTKPYSQLDLESIGVDHFARLPTLVGSNGDDSEEMVKETVSRNLILTKDQIAALLKLAGPRKDDQGSGSRYTRLEVIASHVWRCASIARGLVDEQNTALCLLVDSRSRLNPPLPRYFGDGVLIVVESMETKELVSNSLGYVCQKLREMKEKVTDKYVEASVKFFSEQTSLFKYQERSVFGGPNKGVYFGNPNLTISSMFNIEARGLDFGWGNELYIGTATQQYDGDIMIWPGFQNDGSVSVSVGLQVDYMDMFHKLFYQDIIIGQ